MTNWTSILCGIAVLILLYNQPVTSQIASSTTDDPACQRCWNTTFQNMKNYPFYCEKSCQKNYYEVELINKAMCLNKSHTIVGIGVENTSQETQSTTTTQSPTKVLLCFKCDIANCSLCKKGQEKQVCESCSEGFHFDNTSQTCVVPPADDLSAGDIAGVVIGVLIFGGIAAVAIVFVVRRYYKSRTISGHQDRVKITPLAEVQFNSGSSGELKELPTAPAPPATNAHCNPYTFFQTSCDSPASLNYDKMATNQADQRLDYDPIQFPGEGGCYLNEVPVIENVYANNQHPPALCVTSQPSLDVYEPMHTSAHVDEPQEIYMNENSTNQDDRVTGSMEGIYANQGDCATEDVYENT